MAETRTRIFYSIAGLGRGHACRARAIVEELKHEYEFFLYCPGESFDYLAPIYVNDPDVHVVRLEPCLTFAYRGGGVDSIATSRIALNYLRHLPRNVRFLKQQIVDLKPALAIVDLEPVLPRAARRCGLPLISVDAQGTFVAARLPFLPWKLKIYCLAVRAYVLLICRGQQRMIVSNFARFEICKPYARKAVRVGTILREEVFRLVPQDEGYLVAYLRESSISANVIETLEACGLEVRIYGLDTTRKDIKNLRFKPLGEHFLKDLACCRAIVSTAGNQLFGEAFYFGKPVIAMPEPNHIEQLVNANLLRFTGGGEWVKRDDFTSETLSSFLSNLHRYRERMSDLREAGNSATVAEIRAFLTKACPSQVSHADFINS